MQNTKIKIAHEAPLGLMPLVRTVTDYDYALVHLFEDSDKNFSKDYFKFFEDSMSKGREVILDNSLFELGKSFSPEKFFDWVFKLNPTYYIIPDVFEDREKNIERLENWFKIVDEKKDEGFILESKAIGVLQGSSIKDLILCWKQIQDRVDEIAIPFDCSAFVEDRSKAKPLDYSLGRQTFLSTIANEIEFQHIKKKPVHLLGCYTPQEFKAYRHSDFDFIKSADTSNPIIHGLEGERYPSEGLVTKSKTKMIEYIKTPLEGFSIKQIFDVSYNIGKFKSWL